MFVYNKRQIIEIYLLFINLWFYKEMKCYHLNKNLRLNEI